MGTSVQNVDGHSVQELLRILIEVETHGSYNQDLHKKLISLERKLASNQLQLAVLGQMKRGKSSFINALLGAEILPTGILPATAVITRLKYGLEPRAAIFFTTGHEDEAPLNDLAPYITETGNPGNRKQVASVEISYPSPFLKSGMVLIDTPGIGSTHSHNTRTTENYLEHVDAGIVVLSLEPPITEAESIFIRELKCKIPKLFFILNKIDSASPEEVSCLRTFLTGQLDRLRIDFPEVFSLSAKDAITWKQGRADAVDSSGIEIFERRLQIFLSEEKTRVLESSIALELRHIAHTIKFSRAIGIRARSMDPEELDQKREALDQVLERTDTEVAELTVLLHRHLGEIVGGVERNLAEHVEAAVRGIQQHLEAFQALHPKETGREFGTLLETFLMQEVETTFQSWRVREDEKIQLSLNALSFRFAEQATGIIHKLQQAAGCLFDIPVEPISISCPLRVESGLYYRVERVFYSLDSLLLVLPRFLLRPVVLKKLHRQIYQLLDMNAGRIRYDYVQRLESTVNHFSRELGAAIGIVSDNIRLSLHVPNEAAMHETAVLESVIDGCSLLVGQEF